MIMANHVFSTQDIVNSSRHKSYACMIRSELACFFICSCEIIPFTISECHLSSWFMHSLHRLTRLPGDAHIHMYRDIYVDVEAFFRLPLISCMNIDEFVSTTPCTNSLLIFLWQSHIAYWQWRLT